MQITIDVSDFVRKAAELRGFGSQVRFATARALTQTAVAGRDAVRAEMDRAFDRPTPWAKRMVRYEPATKESLEARVLLSEDTSKNTSAAVALRHEVEGGSRNWKRFEFALQRSGYLGADEIAVPGGAAKIDAYGNMARSQIIQILAYFQAFSQSGYRANTTAKRKAKLAKGTRNTQGWRFWYKRDRRGRGIYLSTRKLLEGKYVHEDMKPVLMFVRRGNYRARLDMAGAVERVARASFQGSFDSALAAAIRTAR